ncbi:hypothetical protein BJY04DRAFT_195675 [Aspergillus karnatakaensis]|uniref:uncharacterized protein n=1 Tax=Aspergillus karnatakaensis TaxID=1810916 RepID=UPI003CCD31CC
MNRFIELGRQDSCSSRSDLKLSLSASATVLLPPGSDELDSIELKEALCSGQIWVSQASELQLNICISSVLELQSSLTLFAPQVGDCICKAKMWSKLGLSALYKHCLYDEDQTSPTYRLSFGLRKRPGGPEKNEETRMPKFLRQVGDAIPPADILTACLNFVDVRMEYKHRRRHSATKALQAESQGDILDAVQPSEPRYWVQNDDYSKDIWFEDELNEPLLDDWETLSEEGLDIIDDVTANPLSASDFGILFRNGLKAVVWGNLRQEGSPGMEGFRSLSSIAPAIFKLGYQETMCQRARLLPSVAKSLASLLMLSDNQTLRDRVSSAGRAHLSSRSSAAPIIEDETKTILRTGLWSIAQRRLHEAPMSKLLKPSNTFLDPERSEQTPEDDYFSGTLSQRTEYFWEDDHFVGDGDDHEPLRFEPDMHFDDDEPSPRRNAEEARISDSGSSMMLENNSTSYAPEEYLGTTSGSDQGMLEFDIEDQPHSNQTSFFAPLLSACLATQ